MSERYPGGFITKTPTAPTSSSAPGIWTLDQAMQNQKAGNWPSPPSPYIEDFFSTYLYTGTGSAQTFTNGVNLSSNGGLVWVKSRSVTGNNWTQDTTRGINSVLYTNLTNAAGNPAGTAVTTFNTTGFSIGTNTNINNSGDTYVSWTFAKRQKFFDIVTYTGNGGTLSVNQALGSKPGCIMIKKTSSTGDWLVCTRKSDGNIYAMYLNTTASQFYDGTEGSLWNSTSVSINWINSNVAAGFNDSGATYVMYVFAHNAGGFGLTGSDNVISCGSFTTDGSGNATVTLGYEPGWVLFKRSDSSTGGSWNTVDNMRGFTANASSNDSLLYSDLADAESTGVTSIQPNATGFSIANGGYASRTYIYIAIRRGPMKVPTTGTSVFNPAYGTGATGSFDTSFPVDMGVYSGASISTGSYWSSRLTASQYLTSFNTNAQATFGTTQPWDRMEDWYATADNRFIGWGFRRAPSFFDVVCYTGTGSATTFSHNLGAVPELMIVKNRTAVDTWRVYSAAGGAGQQLGLNITNGFAATSVNWNNTTPTSTVFSVGGSTSDTNVSTNTYVNYLFATCPGVSKVGSYTGTAALLTVNCGFAAGARFVLIKRADASGDWYVYDSARGLTSGNDPYLLLNSTAAEVTGTNYVDTDTTGFKVTAAAPAGLNASGGTYIFLAIA